MTAGDANVIFTAKRLFRGVWRLRRGDSKQHFGAGAIPWLGWSFDRGGSFKFRQFDGQKQKRLSNGHVSFH